MNNIYIDTNRRTIWLSYEYLYGYDISEGTTNAWSARGLCRRIYIDNRAFLDYDTIPEPTRRKLPTKEGIKAEYKQLLRDNMENFFYNRLKDAYEGKEIVKWINEIRATYEELTQKKATEYARRASVFERVLELTEHNIAKGCLEAIYQAYNRLYPDNYKQKPRFCTAITKARNEGILAVAVDKRSIVKRQPAYADEHKYLAEYILSHNKAYNITTAYDKFSEACIDQKYEIPCFGWFKDYYYKNKPRIDRNRYGESNYQGKDSNYAKIIPALYAGDQWQIDGWTLPIYGYRINEKGGKEYFFRYNLFTVMDAHSRKIIGYDIAESENTDNILRGLEKSVNNTGILPFEIVADNHSFNKTKEANNLKAQTDALGVTWTIDSNPRRKAILERSFRMLGENHFKEYYGYIGQGIRSKIKNGITQQELKDIYTRPENMLSYEQICAIAYTAIYEYNNHIRASLGESPAERYTKSLQPHAIKIDDFKRVSLFNIQSEHTVSNGQITIRRGMHTHEYQLPAQYCTLYNGKRVTVRYADYNEIYLFDLQTGMPICSVKEKMAIHGALANQTDEDIRRLQQNSGRIKGINSKTRKHKESLYDSASTINPNIYEAANRVTTPKDVLKTAAQNNEIRIMLMQQGISVERIEPLPVIDEMLDNSLKPRREDNKHPFSVKPKVITTMSI